MTVYFITAERFGDLVKIGHTSDLNTRMAAIAHRFQCPIELLAMCEGGADVENAFHAVFAESLVENEWFSRTKILDTLINRFAGSVTGKRFWGRKKVSDNTDMRHERSDVDIVRGMMADLMANVGGTTVAESLLLSFDILNGLNPAWTLRRVRAIWNSEVNRVDLYEYRDLLEATCPECGDIDHLAMEAVEAALGDGQ